MASGSLQTCSGIEAGIEAAIHSMRTIFNEAESEAMLLVDATNAFNSLEGFPDNSCDGFMYAQYLLKAST